MNEAQATQPTPTTAAVPPVVKAGEKAPKAIKANKRPSKAKVTKPAAKPAKKAAKPAKAKKAVGDRLVPADLEKYHVDNDKKTPAGNPSVDCDDKVAIMLRGKDLNQVYELVAKQTSKEEGALSVNQLKAKYKHLNVGMQRMNLGNKLRGVLNAK